MSAKHCSFVRSCIVGLISQSAKCCSLPLIVQLFICAARNNDWIVARVESLVLSASNHISK